MKGRWVSEEEKKYWKNWNLSEAQKRKIKRDKNFHSNCVTFFSFFILFLQVEFTTKFFHLLAHSLTWLLSHKKNNEIKSLSQQRRRILGRNTWNIFWLQEFYSIGIWKLCESLQTNQRLTIFRFHCMKFN